MISFFGTLILIIAVLFAAAQTILPIWGYYRENIYASATARPCAWGQFICVFAAYLLLTTAFIKNDFSIAYVAANSHPTLPLLYRCTALWGSHEGSILLWILLLNVWTVLVSINQRLLKIAPLTLSILGYISFLFLCFLLLSSNPFIPAEQFSTGRDLNPLLQDPGFIFHPPLLYTGYVGFAVSFAVTVGALLSRQLNATWAHYTRKYALVAWCFLTLGIILGSWWAYRVLGWGGFWFWDPVENASLMPWIAGIATIHVLILAEKRSTALGWAAFLAILSFVLSLLGTFLVRSGLLISVHSFATDPQRGILLLVLFSLLVIPTFFIYFLCMPTKRIKTNFLLCSRETGLLINSILLSTALGTILIGTLYPLILDALHLEIISVGAPYFNTVMLPLVFTLMFCMGLSIYWSWQSRPAKQSSMLLWRDASCCGMSAMLICWLMLDRFEPTLIITLSLSLWILASLRYQYQTKPGMAMAHIGFAICLLGIVLATTLKQEIETNLHIAEPINLGPYQFTLLTTDTIQKSHYHGIRATISVKKHGRHITTLYPEKRLYPVRDMVMTKTAIHPTFFRDLYIALGEPLDESNWSARIYYKPFIRWIWLGGLLMICGGVLALLPKKFMVRIPR